MADTTKWVWADATGDADGSSKANAYTTIQAAIDNGGFNGGTDQVAEGNQIIYIVEPAAGEYTFTVGNQNDLAGSRHGASDDYTMKFIGCDINGDPFTTRGDRVTIRLTEDPSNGSDEVLECYGANATNRAADNTYFYNLDFNAGGYATQAFRADNGEINESYGWAFVNCRFRNATTYNVYNGNQFAVGVFYDCDFDNDDNTSTNYLNRTSGQGELYYRCKFKANSSSTGYGVYVNDGVGTVFLQCAFDANGESHACRVQSAKYGVVFDNCAFYNYTVAAVYSDGHKQFPHLINCTADAQDPTAD